MNGCIHTQPVDPGRSNSWSWLGYLCLLLGGIGLGLSPGCSSPSGGSGGGGAVETGDADDTDDTGDTAEVLDPNVPPVTDGAWYRPSTDTTWQWQLQPNEQGQIVTTYDVDLYDIDLFDVDQTVITDLQNDGRHVICYFSAGTFEDFREDAPAFDSADLGNTLDDFADERWLDIRSATVQAIMLDRLNLAVAKGCDGVEPDSVTGFNNDSGFDLTAADQLAFNRFIANAAHQRNLSVGLKNDLGQIDELLDYFDFAVNEQCHEFDECEVYDVFVGAQKPVFNAEYAEPFVEDPSQRASMCAHALDQGLRTLVLPVDLDDSLHFSCDE